MEIRGWGDRSGEGRYVNLWVENPNLCLQGLVSPY